MVVVLISMVSGVFRGFPKLLECSKVTTAFVSVYIHVRIVCILRLMHAFHD